MAHHHTRGATQAEHRTHLAVEDAAHLCPGFAHDIDALVVEGHVFQSLHMVLSEMAHDAVATCHGHGQTAPVALEIATDAAVF